MPAAPATADVAVVGAGPAGSAAAITLARQGRRVVLIDKARFPRDKCCGDGLTTAALRYLHHVGLDPRDVPSWQPVSEAVIRTSVGREAAFPLPAGGTFAATARRSDLDAALVRLAGSAGAEVVEDCAVRAAELLDGRGVEVETDGPALRARYVIAADGMWSPLRKSLGVADEEAYRGDWHALRQYFAGVGPRAGRLWVWFEPDLLPGYAWSFPLPDGRANVGFGIRRDARRPVGSLGPLWAEILDRPHIRAVLGPDVRAEAGPKTWPIPARIGTAPLSAGGGRVLFVGDAARATDVLTGEGIAQAFETGELAARSVTAAGPDHAGRAATVYRRVVGAGLAADDRTSRAVARVLARPGDRWMSLAAASDWTRRNFARWMFEDYPRALLATPHRWRRPMLAGPPPYPAPEPGRD